MRPHAQHIYGHVELPLYLLWGHVRQRERHDYGPIDGDADLKTLGDRAGGAVFDGPV